MIDYSDAIEANEEAIKNTSEKYMYQPDNFNYKVNDDFFMDMYMACKQNKEFGLLIWFIRSMQKNNIVYNVVGSEMMKKAEMSKPTYYRTIKNMIDNEIMIKIDKKTFMVNPNLVINHRKSINKDRPQLLALWSEYIKQARDINSTTLNPMK